jgi:hypothetical protein
MQHRFCLQFVIYPGCALSCYSIAKWRGPQQIVAGAALKQGDFSIKLSGASLGMLFESLSVTHDSKPT